MMLDANWARPFIHPMASRKERNVYMKRVVTIQDISCLGRCSITIALPVLSAMGIETAILPTALLSTHSLFPDFTFCDLSGQMQPIADHWKKEGVHFDGIYTGYLGSRHEIETVCRLIRDFRTPDTLVFVDPVMGDNGKLYSGFDGDYVVQNEALCAEADVIVPNITEACFLTGNEYKSDQDEAYIRKLLMDLSVLGAHLCVITGVSLSEGKTGFMGYDPQEKAFFSYQNERVPGSFHGTGDLFSSVSVGALMRGQSWQKAFALAADYTAQTIAATIRDADGEDRRFGVHFETTLPSLLKV